MRVPLWRIGRRGQCPSCSQEFRAACTADFLDELPEQMRRVLVLCEHCNAEYVSPIELLGVKTRCLSCQRRFRRRLLREHIDFRGNGHARVACPQCQENFVIRRSKLGKNSRCEKCGQTFLLAERESSTGSGFLDQAVTKPATDRPRKPKRRPERDAEGAIELPLPPQAPAAADDDLLSLLDDMAQSEEPSLEALAADAPQKHSETGDPCDGTEVLVAVVETDDDAPLPLEVDEPVAAAPPVQALPVDDDADDEVEMIAPEAEVIQLDDDEPAETTPPAEVVEHQAVVDVDLTGVVEDAPVAAEPLPQPVGADEVTEEPPAALLSSDEPPLHEAIAEQREPVAGASDSDLEEAAAADMDDPLVPAVEDAVLNGTVEQVVADVADEAGVTEPLPAEAELTGTADAAIAALADVPGPDRSEDVVADQSTPDVAPVAEVDVASVDEIGDESMADPDDTIDVAAEPVQYAEQTSAETAIAVAPAASPRHKNRARRGGLLSRLKRAIARDEVSGEPEQAVEPAPEAEVVNEMEESIAAESPAPVAAPSPEPAEPDADAPTPPLEQLITLHGDFEPLTLEPVFDATELSFILPPQFDLVDRDMARHQTVEPEPAAGEIDCKFSNIPLVEGGDISDVESVNDSSPPDSELNLKEAVQPSVADNPVHAPHPPDAAETLSFDDAMAELETLAAESETEPQTTTVETAPEPELAPAPAVDQVPMKSVSLEHIATCRGHTRPVFSVDVSADGATAISGGLDGVLRLWDLATGACTRELPAGAGMIWRVALFDDGRKAVSAHEDGAARIWDLAAGECIAKVPGPADHVQSTCFSGDGAQMLAGDAAGMLSLIDLNTVMPRRFKGHQGRMTAAKFAGVDRAITAGEDNLVRIWDLTNLRCAALLEGHTRPARSVALDGAGTVAVSGGDDCTVRVWDVATGKCRLTIQPADKRINAVWISGDGALLACGGDDGVLRLYDAASGNPLHEARDHRLWISAISAAAPASGTRTIVSAGWDLLLNVYHLG